MISLCVLGPVLVESRLVGRQSGLLQVEGVPSVLHLRERGARRGLESLAC